MAEKRVITYSEFRSWITCRQQHDWAYAQGFRPKESSRCIMIGSVVHRLIEQLYKEKWDLSTLQAKAREYLLYGKSQGWYADMTDEEYQADRAVVVAMLTGYHVHFFQTEGFQAYLPEMEFALDFGDFVLTGKIDGVVRHQGKYFLHEIKTKTMWGEDDRQMLRMDDQVSVYLLALMAKWQNPFLQGYYTVLKKPSTKPNLKKEYRVVDKNTGQPLFDESFRLKSDAQRKEKELKGTMENYNGEIVYVERIESPQEYEERLINDYLNRSEFYFDRQVVSRTREEIQDMIEKIRTVVSEIGVLKPYRSQGIHCGWCDFREVCMSGRESRNLALQYYFQKKETRHEELDGVEVIPANLDYIYRKAV